MIYCIFFEDDERYAEARQLHMKAHLEFLNLHSRHVRSAGPLADPSSQKPAGGLWVVEAPDSDVAWGLVKADPFWPTGLRKSVRVVEWQQVFPAAAG